MNPLFNNQVQGFENNQNQIMQNLSNNLQELKKYKSPQDFLQALQRENPQGYQYLINLSQTLRDPVGTAMQELNKRGINFNQIINMLNQ
jgi:hypothetical protein